jgi:hypothetical protein
MSREISNEGAKDAKVVSEAISASPPGSAMDTIMLAGTIGAILVRHGVIDRAAIEDPEGYDGGQLKQRVIDATIAIAKEARLRVR